LEVEHFEAVPGHGIEAKISGKNILVGNRKLMNDHQINTAGYEEKLVNYETDGKTAMLIAIDGEYRGTIVVADTIKEKAHEGLKQLKELGIEVCMLTSNNERTAKAIAKQVGIDQVIAEVLPEEKAAKVKAIQEQGKKVAMVGDGVNDAPALVTADIGIAIGTGTEVAIEAADVTILGGELLLIPKAIKISHATIRNIR